MKDWIDGLGVLQVGRILKGMNIGEGQKRRIREW